MTSSGNFGTSEQNKNYLFPLFIFLDGYCFMNNYGRTLYSYTVELCFEDLPDSANVSYQMLLNLLSTFKILFFEKIDFFLLGFVLQIVPV